VNATEIIITEEVVHNVVKGQVANVASDSSDADSDVEQVKPQANSIEWKLPVEDVTSDDEPKDHPLKALGDEIPEDRAEYLKRLRKIEDGYEKRLTFGEDEVSTYQRVSINLNEANETDSADAVSGSGHISSKFVTETVATQYVSEVIGENATKVKDDLAIDDMMFDYPLITHPCESRDNNLLAVHNFAQTSTQIIQLEGVQFLKSVYHSYPDKLQDLIGNEETSLSSLLVLGKVKNAPRLLCL
jgi:hypothetical protein